MKSNKMAQMQGQEAIEFILISALVFFAALFTILIFGNKLANFFMKDSAAVKVAGYEAPRIAAVKQYNPDYQTEGATSNAGLYDEYLPPEAGSINITDADVQSIISSMYPDNLKQVIESTGASGGTDDIADLLAALAGSLKTLAEENPADPKLLDMANMANDLAFKGHLVADCEEWFEAAAERLNTLSGVTLPPDNMICEFGQVSTPDNPYPGCDMAASSAGFFFTDVGRKNIENNLTAQLTAFKDLNSTLQAQALSDNTKAQQILATIDALALEIEDIAANVKTAALTLDSTYSETDTTTQYKQFLISHVASETTDIKSDLIEGEGDNLTKLWHKYRQ